MIHAFADASFDSPILSVGYVCYQSDGTDRELLDMGTRIVNTEATDRRIDWCSTRGEYYGAIVATRAALDYTHEPLLLHLDNQAVVESINNERRDGFEPYFHHALNSFLKRFNDYYVQEVSRENDEVAHEQARIGLKVGRKVREQTC